MLLPGVSETSEMTQQLVDQEVRRIVEAAHHEVLDLLRSRRDQLDSLVAELLRHETLDEADAYAAAGLTRADAAVPAQLNGTNPGEGPEPIGAVGMPSENDNLA